MGRKEFDPRGAGDSDEVKRLGKNLEKAIIESEYDDPMRDPAVQAAQDQMEAQLRNEGY